MVIDIISQDRLSRYLRASGHDKDRALALYAWNIQISEAFFPVLSAAEVCLRNIVTERLRELYGDQWWGQQTFLDHFNGQGKRIVFTARDKVSRNGAVTSGKMTAELNFGFWVKMLLPRHEHTVWANFRSSFYQLPATICYADLYSRCVHVLELRNRIFHHEPIFDRDISLEHQKILELVSWLSVEKEIWIRQYSRVMTVLRSKP